MTLARLIEAVAAGTFTRTDFSFGGWHPEVSYDDARGAFLGSLDAAKRLHDALLPGWVVRLTAGTDQSSFPYVHIFKPRQTEDDPERGANSSGYRGYDPARAWLLAILRAMEGRDGRWRVMGEVLHTPPSPAKQSNEGRTSNATPRERFGVRSKLI